MKHGFFQQLLDYIGVAAIGRAVLSHWLGERLSDLWTWLISTHPLVHAAWRHKRDGHPAPSPQECVIGPCALVPPKMPL